MCVICDGGSYDELHFTQFGNIMRYGFTVTMVEDPPTWAYTIGLTQTSNHPELVVTGLPQCCVLSIINEVVDLIRDGERFNASAPPLDLDWGRVRFEAVHPAQWDQGRFDQWIRYYDALGSMPDRDVLQVVWADPDGRFPDDGNFHGEQALLDAAPRHNVNAGPNREARRRGKYGHGTRRRR